MFPTADERPLVGIRVVDLTSYTPGPLCTAMLADLGAEITKVERPGMGDPGRSTTPGTYRVLNRYKRVVQYDLKDPVERDGVLELTDAADVVVTAFRAGVAERLGVGADQSSLRDPRLIYCAINGFGGTSTAPAHDVDVAARVGLLWMSGDPETAPRATGAVPHVDVATATFAAQAILAALLRRERTGRGARLEVPMTAAALKLLEFRLADHMVAGSPARREFLTRSAYGVFLAADGRQVAIAALTDRDWTALVGALGWSALSNDAHLANSDYRENHRDVVRRLLADAFATRPAEEWIKRLEAVGVPVAPVLAPEDLADDPAIRALGVLRPASEDRLLEVAFQGGGLGTAPVREW